MTSIEPFIRHIILCEDIRNDPESPAKLDVFGMLSSIGSHPQSTFPLRYPQFCVYIEFTGGRGKGMFRVEVTHAGTETTIFEHTSQPVLLKNKPLAVNTLKWRIRNCEFP